MEKECPYCLSQFTTDSHRKKYCQIKCQKRDAAKRQRERNRNNPEYKRKNSEKFREWYQKNKDYHKEYMREYYQKNKEKHSIRAFAHNHLRDSLLERYNHQCADCGGKEALENHHKEYVKKPHLIYDQIKGEAKQKLFEEEMDRCVILCWACHRRY